LENIIASSELQLQFEKDFPIFQELISLLISEKMKIIGTSSNGGSKDNAFYSNISRCRNTSDRTSFRGGHENSHGEVQIL
jgi:hypothetical protein